MFWQNRRVSEYSRRNFRRYGPSAEYAMRGKRRFRVFMLSPQGKMSRFQTAQMFCWKTRIFSFCRSRRVRRLPGHRQAFSTICIQAKIRIGTVNSINWAYRGPDHLLFQRVFRSYPSIEQLSFAVPSGNFGNICAGHVARMMGLPIRTPDTCHQ